jgi:hypothetical protein
MPQPPVLPGGPLKAPPRVERGGWAMMVMRPRPSVLDKLRAYQLGCFLAVGRAWRHKNSWAHAWVVRNVRNAQSDGPGSSETPNLTPRVVSTPNPTSHTHSTQ